jgi:hypothetical protein
VITFVSDLRATGWCFSPGTMVSSTNKTDRHDIAEISDVLVYHLNKITFYLFNAISSFGNLLTTVSSLNHLKFK